MKALDYGEAGKLRVHDVRGVFELDKNTRGLSAADKFAETIERLLEIDDLVTESPTPGSSGAEAEKIRDVVQRSKHTLYVISARAVKNYIKTHDLPPQTDAECAEIIYKIATGNPAALREWRYIPKYGKFKREITSVRPYDKRGYKGPEVDYFMSLLPAFDSLPTDLRDLLTDGKVRHPDYARARVLPFAMALTEQGADSRGGYEKILGLYAHGYPSFYRRATVSLMQRVAKEQAQVSHVADLTPEQRKQAWKVVRRSIRRLYYLSGAK